jgi:Leucine-rich repeat (LRR) protein
MPALKYLGLSGNPFKMLPEVLLDLPKLESITVDTPFLKDTTAERLRGKKITVFEEWRPIQAEGAECK